MRLNLKVAVFIAAATLALGMSVATALAAAAQQESVALLVGDEMGSGYAATYGGSIAIAPVVTSKIELPGEKFSFQIYAQDSTTDTITGERQWKWIPYFVDFEDIQLEDTNTVPAFGYRLGVDDAVILTDGTAVSPIARLTADTIGYTPLTTSTYGYLIRMEYKARDTSGTANSTAPKSYTETETVSIIKNDSTRVVFSKTGTARHAGTKFNFQVSPNCGVGTVRVIVKKTGSPTLTYNIVTDENGHATRTLKLGTKHGTYKVYTKFLGNVWGVASPTATKSVTVNR